MIRKIIGIILLNFLTHSLQIYNKADVEVYSIQSIDGKSQRILIEPNFVDNQLIISCLSDTIKISNFTGFDEHVRILHNNFLEIPYKIRGGSNIKLRHVLILCVNNNRLYQAIHVRSLSSYDVDRVYNKRADSLKLFDEHGTMSLKYDLIESFKKQYSLNVYIHDEIKSKRNPKTNHIYNKQVALSFDASENIFYSSRENVSQYFTIYDPKTQRESKQYVMGTFPVVKLDKTNYYYIKGEWYENDGNNSLLKYAYK